MSNRHTPTADTQHRAPRATTIPTKPAGQSNCQRNTVNRTPGATATAPLSKAGGGSTRTAERPSNTGYRRTSTALRTGTGHAKPRAVETVHPSPPGRPIQCADTTLTSTPVIALDLLCSDGRRSPTQEINAR